jgi:hypothetical protein
LKFNDALFYKHEQCASQLSVFKQLETNEI